MGRKRLFVIAVILLSMTALAQRTRLRAGRNLIYSPADDVKMGQEVAKDAERQLVLVNDRDANAYIANLGNQLVAKSPNENKFPFTFKIVNERSINAFALPGGPIYVHRGAIEAADNEAQLAGVIGHEISHIILRHGTSQAAKGQGAQTAVGILGGLLGNNRTGQLAAGLGNFVAGSVLMRYSRDAETQSDLMGTQILYDSGYDPIGMAQFFEKLAKDHKGSKTEQFFSDHPIPENRVAKVNDEIRRIGAPRPNPQTDTAAFQRVKKTMLSMPEPPKAPAKAAAATQPAAPSSSTAKPAAPPAPSARLTDLQAAGIQLRHPENWKPAVQGTHITIAPPGGAVNGGLAYGMIIDVFKPQNARSLDDATAQFVESLRKDNPTMKVVRSRISGRIDNRPAQLTELTSESPLGGQETDVVITLMRSSTELLYFVEVAPTKDMPQYQTTFQTIRGSVRLP